MGSTWSGVLTVNPSIPAPSAIFAKSGLCRSVANSRKPDAFCSSSTNASDSFLKIITFTGNFSCFSVMTSHEHRETAVARHRDNLAAGIGSLRPNSVRQRVGHRSMVEGTEETPFPVHGEIACCPNCGCTYVAGENRVVGCEFVDHTRNVLGMNRTFVGISCCQFIQAIACLPVVFQRILQVLLI